MTTFLVQYSVLCEGWEEVRANTEQEVRDMMAAKRAAELIANATTLIKTVNTVEEQEDA